MNTNPQIEYTELALRLVNACSQHDYMALAQVLECLDGDRVDVAVYIRGDNAHLNFVGGFRSISSPRFPEIIAAPPDIPRIAADKSRLS
ncbi:MAG TPA: hypothetical protein VFA32_14515 [Dehalococcoidia bacterium]|jgi:hypothetical protein|nr:hypothetical protein [Dehalococcoidia bacterium]